MVVPGEPVPGALLSGELVPGVVLSGELVPGALLSGVLLPGTLPFGELLAGTVVDPSPALASIAVTMTPLARLAAKSTRPPFDSRRTSNSVGLACPRPTVNHPGCGAKATTRNTPPAESSTTLAASPARNENWVAEPGTGAELTVAGVGAGEVAGAEAGVELAVDPESGVLDAVELDDADAESGAPLTWPATLVAVAVASRPLTERTLTVRDFMNPTVGIASPSPVPATPKKRPILRSHQLLPTCDDGVDEGRPTWMTQTSCDVSAS